VTNKPILEFVDGKDDYEIIGSNSCYQKIINFIYLYICCYNHYKNTIQNYRIMEHQFMNSNIN
jgi:hypothetical protein